MRITMRVRERTYVYVRPHVRVRMCLRVCIS